MGRAARVNQARCGRSSGALCLCSDGKRLGFTSVLERYNIVSEGDLGQAADRLAHYLGSQRAKAGDFLAGPLATETRQ